MLALFSQTYAGIIYLPLIIILMRKEGRWEEQEFPNSNRPDQDSAALHPDEIASESVWANVCDRVLMPVLVGQMPRQ